MINQVDMDGSGKVRKFEIILQNVSTFWYQVEWHEFAGALAKKLNEVNTDEVKYKETFRVFSKDDQGKCL